MKDFINKIYENIVIKLVILLATFSCIIIVNHNIANKIAIECKDLQNVYYFFSTSAQSISSFIALLIAGYALVFQAMDNLENRDDTLREIHHRIKIDYYKKIRKLCFVTGASVILSLVMVWTNGYQTKFKNELLLITVIFIALAIVMGLFFVIYIIDPDKIRKAAVQLINERYSREHSEDEIVDEGTFITAFISLERFTREIIQNNELVMRYQNRNREFISFREMIEILLINELLDREFYNQLLEINRYRNLVVHGHINQVSRQMLQMTQEVISRIEEIRNRLSNRNQ